MFRLLNDHTANTILFFGFAEVIVVAWLYGVNNFLQDIKDMSIPMPRHGHYQFNKDVWGRWYALSYNDCWVGLRSELHELFSIALAP